MAVEVTCMGHSYVFRHPAGWSGGLKEVRDKLNETLPVGDYPAAEAEELAVRRALMGILSGGEAIDLKSGRHVLGGRDQGDLDEDPTQSTADNPDRILSEDGDEEEPRELDGDRDRLPDV